MCQKSWMPQSLNVPVLQRGHPYAGMLTGPAVIGFLSKEIGLHNAFWFLAVLLACVPIFGKFLTVENPR
jgi:hypothetical protein